MLTLPHPNDLSSEILVVPVRVGNPPGLLAAIEPNLPPFNRHWQAIFQLEENARGEIIWTAYTQSFSTGLRWKAGRAVPL